MAGVNDMTFNQLSTVLNAISKQATGQSAIAPVNTAEFISVANTTLQTGYDSVLNAISQVLSRTIFSIRPYERRFGGLMADNVRYGNHVRKLQSADKPWEDDSRKPLTDGESVDQYKVNKPTVLQTNFYGQNVFQKSLTIFRDQLDVAFTGPDEFGRFVSMVMTNASDMIEQAHETVERATLANFIGGKIRGDTANVLKLVTLYNTEVGGTYTSATIKDPDVFPNFVRWLYGYIKTISNMMAERSVNYHINVTGKEISRHTPIRKQKIYMLASLMNQVESNVLAQTFHNNFLQMADYEEVSFWQAINSPDTINITPTYLLPTGTLTTATDAVEQDNVVGLIFDEEAVGVTMVNNWSASSPFNAKGGYSNMFWHFTDRYWNDFTENGVILLLE